MFKKVRNILIGAGVALGLIAATATPAMAGINLANHSRPTIDR